MPKDRPASAILRTAMSNMIPCLIALPIGAATGALDALFGRVLLAIGVLRDAHLVPLVAALPLAGLAIVWMYRRFGGRAGEGMGLVFEVGLGRDGEIPLRLIPLVMLSTWATHLTGGSAGREGVAVQMGAALSHQVGRILAPLGHDFGNTFLIMGMAAGFSGLFHTPLAATAFAMEVLVAGNMAYRSLFPALVAALVSCATSEWLGLTPFVAPISHLPTLDAGLGVRIVVLGIACGVVGGGFAWALARAKSTAARVVNPYLRVAGMGAVLSILILSLGHGRYAGLGTNLIGMGIAGSGIEPWDWALKFALTAATLAAGFQGGEVTPLFSIGASLGAAVAPLLGLPVPLAAALGYVGVFCGATNTFLAPVLIAAEIFGFGTLPLAFLLCAASYSCNRNSSIYAKQLIAAHPTQARPR
ncbi:MAG: chloride channel protein [Collinsella sp.]|nr:chloride channel protein [Collinsella sp.]